MPTITNPTENKQKFIELVQNFQDPNIDCGLLQLQPTGQCNIYVHYQYYTHYQKKSGTENTWIVDSPSPPLNEFIAYYEVDDNLFSVKLAVAIFSSILSHFNLKRIESD